MFDLKRADIEAKTICILRPGAGSRPDVRLIEHKSQRMVLKDYSGGNTTLKALGLMLLWREQAAYQRLEGMEGVPRCYGRLDPYTLVTQYVDACQSSDVPTELLTEDLFVRLRLLVDAMHARGVVHGDLKRLDNILISADGTPYLIDFSAAFWNGSNPAAAFIMPYLIDDDIRAVYKLKFRRVPELLTPAEEVFLNARSPVERGFRVVREYFRGPVQKLAASNDAK
jgi:RIO-like serine/threonine protein kinase